jgi:hypothetical protein
LWQLFGKLAHWSCSTPWSGPAAAPQRERSGLKIIGMPALMSRTKGRRAAKRQRQWSTSAWFRDPFATFSWPREAHIYRSRVSNSIGGAESHSYTLSRCRRAKSQGPSRVGNPRYLSLIDESHCPCRKPVATNPICNKRTPSANNTLFSNVLWSLFRKEQRNSAAKKTLSIR